MTQKQKTFDTNICSYVLRRHPQEMLNRFSKLNQDEVWLSSIVAAELRFGVAKLASPRFSAAVEAWLDGFEIRPWPVEATHHYAHIRCELEKMGRPIGGMDLMIAAHAQSEQSTLITNNAQEFSRISTLSVEEWKL
ncbi:type II toxin-antitoxin system VapC family toxin [Polynucleobacter sp. CS-Odin-A6]|uniref:type II toxin-antitoxin system VapC family toxin n=1 Tax=Polynucleobacter sp. CS-Odin-A6 TaxID=2689106 RepID=UPI001C0BD01B|nr:type II toxin-antitoxin system VapC family toxin [Polynucleobacter sp. CS-Odin-A6]MBU3621138.1 type II toxin-antitoxin system VapC family toxin [Polynucleobacter sp. CS-Odin-A6]